jgi:hypothetical protein
MTVHQVTTSPVPPYAGTEVAAPEVMAILHRLNPAALQEAGAAHTALGRELDTMAAQLAREAGTLAQHWSGAAARNALAQFARLHTQTATLAAQASRTGSVLTWLGTQVVPAFRDPADSSQAQKYLTQLSAALVRANTALPTQIGSAATAQLASAAAAPDTSSNLPGPTHQASPASATTSGPGAPIGPANTASNTPGGPASTTDTVGPVTPADPGTASSTTSPGSTLSSTAIPGKAPAVPTAGRLQSAAPDPVSSVTSARPASAAAAAGPAPTSVGAAAAAAPAPLMSRFSFRPGRAKQAPADRDDGQDSGLSGGALPVQPADPASSALTAATPAPADPSSPSPLSTLPMAGGISSPGEHERHRESWAPEDRNPWGLPDTCVPPLVEGS